MKRSLGSLRWLASTLAVLVLTSIGMGVAGAQGEDRRAPRRKPAQASPSRAPKASSSKKTTGSTFAVVVSQTSQIYARPDLDAPVISIVQQGMRLPISRGTRGDFAKFHRTRVNGKLGWIVTIDVRSENVAKKILKAKAVESMKPGPFADDPKDDGERPAGAKEREPYAFVRTVSFIVGLANYKEAINGVNYNSNLLTYGLKLTGPDVLLTGPLMDLNVMFHHGAPDYYSPLSSIPPSGFLMWIDANLLLPIRMRENHLIALGAGPLLVLSNIQSSQGAQAYDMWALNVGANVELSAGMRFDDFSVRLDGRYLFENKSYYQFQLGLGTVF